MPAAPEAILSSKRSTLDSVISAHFDKRKRKEKNARKKWKKKRKRKKKKKEKQQAHKKKSEKRNHIEWSNIEWSRVVLYQFDGGVGFFLRVFEGRCW
jgi:mannitol-specific phosphotransferase system IIBC component